LRKVRKVICSLRAISAELLPRENNRRISFSCSRSGQFRLISPIEPSNGVRGQFQGYRNENSVAPDSQVGTFAAVRLHIESWRWAGVPFLIRAGKCLPVTATKVLVTLKKPPVRSSIIGDNYRRFRLGPDLSLSLGAQVKRPGPGMASLPVTKDKSAELAAYEPSSDR
jgi:glucose-6-phosphate 1-dehydrogenase